MQNIKYRFFFLYFRAIRRLKKSTFFKHRIAFFDARLITSHNTLITINTLNIITDDLYLQNLAERSKGYHYLNKRYITGISPGVKGYLSRFTTHPDFIPYSKHLSNRLAENGKE